MSLSKLVEHITVGKNWKEIGGDHVVTITEISRDFADKTMVAFKSDCCLSSSPLTMFLKDFTPVINNDMSKSDSEIDMSDDSVNIVNTMFKVGDKVYKFGDDDVKNVLEVFEYGYMRISNYPHRVNHESICHATPENHALLSKLHPHIKFEAPPKELMGSDLCRAMLEKGWKYVPCYVHDGSDDEAINRKHYVSVKNETPRSGYNFSGTGINDWKYAVPIDPRTGEPLTQAVLDD